MPDDRYEPNRVLGLPIRTRRDPHTGQLDEHAGQREEPQVVMGFPVDWFGPADRDWLGPLAHPIREYRRWARRLGPDAIDEDEPDQPR